MRSGAVDETLSVFQLTHMLSIPDVSDEEARGLRSIVWDEAHHGLLQWDIVFRCLREHRRRAGNPADLGMHLRLEAAFRRALTESARPVNIREVGEPFLEALWMIATAAGPDDIERIAFEHSAGLGSAVCDTCDKDDSFPVVFGHMRGLVPRDYTTLQLGHDLFRLYLASHLK